MNVIRDRGKGKEGSRNACHFYLATLATQLSGDPKTW